MEHKGLTRQQVEESRKLYGANTLTEIPPDPLWKKILDFAGCSCYSSRTYIHGKGRMV